MHVTAKSVQEGGSRIIYDMTLGTKYNIVVEGYQNEGRFNLTVKNDSEQSYYTTFPHCAGIHTLAVSDSRPVNGNTQCILAR
jgi:hypothetical protein